MPPNAVDPRILTMRVDLTSHDHAVGYLLGLAKEATGRYVCVANVHMCMEAFDDPVFRSKVNNADLVVPDGRPLVWGLRMLGHRAARQVRGADLLLNLCGKAEEQGIPIGLYGGVPESLHDFQTFLQARFPGLRIACAISPPFRPLLPMEDAVFTKQILDSEARILFVGIGCPKQENWMAAHKETLPCVMIGVGAAFDFFSGRKEQAPRWMQKTGLEWVFRLMSDPRRLWKRYLKHNPRFVWHFGRQILQEKFKG